VRVYCEPRSVDGCMVRRARSEPFKCLGGSAHAGGLVAKVVGECARRGHPLPLQAPVTLEHEQRVW